MPLLSFLRRDTPDTDVPELELEATPEIQAAAGKTPKVTILAYAGGMMNVSGFGPVVIDIAGMSNPDSVPLLGDHENRLQAVVGSGRPSASRGQLYVEGSLTTSTKAGETVLKLHRDGIALQASVGATPIESRMIPKGEVVEVNGRTITAGESGFVLVTKSRLREVTITPIGADDQTAVSIAANRGANPMAKATILTDNPNPSSYVDPVLGERERIKQINATLDQAGEFMQASQVAQLREEAIDGSLSVADLNSRVLQALRASRSQAPAIGGHRLAPGVTAGQAVEAALMIRAGFQAMAEKEYGEQALESAREFRSMSMLELCRASLQAAGMPSSLSKSELISAAFGPSMIQASGPSTFSIPVALSNVTGKSLMAAYRDAKATWRAFCDIRSASDFKDKTGVRPSFVSRFEEVGADGELKSASLKEASFPYSVDTYGEILSATRQDLINDDLSFIETATKQMAPAAVRKLSDLVYTALMGATSAYFDASLGNLTTTALSVASLGAARSAMRKQRDAKNNDLDIEPATLLVPPELEDTAKTVLDSEFTERVATAADVDEVRGTGNPQKQTVKLEVESRLSNTAKFANADVNNWYLFASPKDAPMIVAYLDGMIAPVVEFFGLQHEVSRLVVSWRAFQDFGAALGDYRAAHKAAVT